MYGTPPEKFARSRGQIRSGNSYSRTCSRSGHITFFRRGTEVRTLSGVHGSGTNPMIFFAVVVLIWE